MRSVSASDRAAAVAVALLLLATASGVGAAPAAEAPRFAVGWIPSKDASVARDLRDGATLAIEQAEASGGARLVLRVGESDGPWGTVAAAAVRLVTAGGAVALVSPPERDAAHLLAQVATKTRVPVVVTSRAPSVTQAGTTWTVRVVPRGGPADESVSPPPFDAASPAAAAFVRSFRERFSREPSAWSAAGYDALRALALGLDRRKTADGHGLLAAVRSLDGPPGAAAPLRFDARGDRLPR